MKDENNRTKRRRPLHPKEPRLIHRQGIGGLVLEGAMIVLSILLALGLENWNEHRKESARCRTALVQIRKEIAWNRREMAGVLEEHGVKIEALRSAAGIYSGKNKGNAVIDATLSFPEHRSIVFNAAMTGRTLGPLDYETILPIMECYSSHAWLLKFEDTWFQCVLQFDMDVDRSRMANQLGRLAGILQNYRQIEEGAVAQCDSATAAIDRVLAKGE
jgi:hypothetical protein